MKTWVIGWLKESNHTCIRLRLSYKASTCISIADRLWTNIKDADIGRARNVMEGIWVFSNYACHVLSDSGCIKTLRTALFKLIENCPAVGTVQSALTINPPGLCIFIHHPSLGVSGA